MSKTYSIALWAVTSTMLMLITNTVYAGKPIIGVTCRGGFFVLAPDKNIFWVDDVYENKHKVYEGKDSLVAMSQCGDGVVTVFKNSERIRTNYTVVYSEDCMNVGSQDKNSKILYEGTDPIRQIKPSKNDVTLVLKEGKKMKYAEGCEI